MRINTKDMILCAVFASIICICSVISLPTGVVPVTLGTFGVMLTGNTLGIKKGLISTVIFILIGIIGLPVFSGFQSGIGALVSPTGGYITGYIFMPMISGLGIKATHKSSTIVYITSLNIIALILCYLFGITHFINTTGFGIETAFTTCIAPFIIFDIIKAIGAAMIAINIKNRM